jgi:hypothetical protein
MTIESFVMNGHKIPTVAQPARMVHPVPARDVPLVNFEKLD